MKKLTKNSSGFTLIEIIVVLIILGVLAAIALPSLFSNVTRSRGAEALAALSGYRTQVVGCIQGHGAAAAGACDITGSLVNSPNFTYAMTNTPANADPTWAIRATGTAAGGFNAGGADTITLTSDATGLAGITCQGAGLLAGVC